MKILLAEDDRNLGKLLAILLKKNNIAVDWVENGDDAYDKVYSDGYDCLVLDWNDAGIEWYGAVQALA